MFKSILRHLGVRERLLALILCATMPLAALLVGGFLVDFRETLARARTEVREAANLAAAREGAIFAHARILLESLRQLPGVDAAGGAACDAIVTRIRDANPQFNTMGVFDADGTIRCHTSLRRPQPFGDEGVAAQVLSPEGPQFVLSRFQVGKASGKPTIIAAVELPRINGRIPGAIFASFNLDRLSEVAAEASAGGKRAVTLVEAGSGRLIARFPALGSTFGEPYPDHPLVRSIQASPFGGVAEVPSLDGVERVEGFAPLMSADVSDLTIAVGVSRDDVLGPVRSRAVLLGGFLVGAIALTLLVTWRLGREMQLEPIGRLADAARRIGSGDLEARARLEDWQAREYLNLAATLDDMAGKLAKGRDAEREVTRSQARYRILAENTADLVTLVDPSGRRVYVSPACREMLGYEPEELMAADPQDLAHPDDLPILAGIRATLESGANVTAVQYRARHRKGHFIAVEVSGRIVEGDGDVVFLMRDVTKRVQAEESLRLANLRLADLAFTDALTGLANRRAFDSALLEAIARSVREGKDVGVVMLDVDRFKAYNDTYGHQAGDACLNQVAAALRSELRSEDEVIARYGGEEFTVVLPGSGLEETFARAEAMAQALRALKLPHVGSDTGIVSVSAGVSVSRPGYGFSGPDDLVRAADRALYAAKAAGRDRVAA